MLSLYPDTSGAVSINKSHHFDGTPRSTETNNGVLPNTLRLDTTSG